MNASIPIHRSRQGPRSALRQRGFTLIELMITAAIVAILAAIAIPAYQDSVWKGKRAEARAAIQKALQAEERYYTNNNTYVLANTLAAATRGAFPMVSADSAANSRYTISYLQSGVTGLCTDNDLSRCVIVQATVVGSSPDPKCGTTLSMDNVGNKTSAVSDAICWR